jgi:hypothetical protein
MLWVILVVQIMGIWTGFGPKRHNVTLPSLTIREL